jgi:glycerol-3-phosphate acyltransferase PlsY
MEITTILIAIVFGYLLGSIPFGLIITKMAGLGDIRSIGSGNIGATNVLRTGRKDIAIITLILDAGKAGLALAIARHFYGIDAGFIAGAAAFFGHCFPVWLKFKGGKGVATFFGTLLVGSWPVGLLAAGIWLAFAFVFRFSSLAALAAAILAPLFGLLFHLSAISITAICFLSLLIIVRHHENIARLLKGEEPKIGAKKSEEAKVE